jgi:hypothetical protein
VLVASHQRGAPLAGDGHQVVVGGVGGHRRLGWHVWHEPGAVDDEVEDLIAVARRDARGQVRPEGDAR